MRVPLPSLKPAYAGNHFHIAAQRLQPAWAAAQPTHRQLQAALRIRQDGVGSGTRPPARCPETRGARPGYPRCHASRAPGPGRPACPPRGSSIAAPLTFCMTHRACNLQLPELCLGTKRAPRVGGFDARLHPAAVTHTEHPNLCNPAPHRCCAPFALHIPAMQNARKAWTSAGVTDSNTGDTCAVMHTRHVIAAHCLQLWNDSRCMTFICSLARNVESNIALTQQSVPLPTPQTRTHGSHIPGANAHAAVLQETFNALRAGRTR